MSFNHNITVSVSANGAVPIGTSYTVTAGAELNLSEVVPGGSTDLEIACVLDVSQMKSLVLYCADRDMTVETNVAGSPVATVSLKAGKPLVWESTQGQDNPFGSTDVTKLFVTLAAGDDATLEMRSLIDPTV